MFVMQNLVTGLTDPIAEYFQHGAVHECQDMLFRGDVSHVVHVVEYGAEAGFTLLEFGSALLDACLESHCLLAERGFQGFLARHIDERFDAADDFSCGVAQVIHVFEQVYCFTGLVHDGTLTVNDRLGLFRVEQSAAVTTRNALQK